MRFKENRGQRANPTTVPAPIGGLNGRDGIANMPALDAMLLDNWVPKGNNVYTRKGCSNWRTGVVYPVESLEVYEGGSSAKMLAFAGGSVYVVPTTGGAGVIGAALATGRSSNIVTTTMFSNAGSQFLLGVSGADAPFSYDGTTFTALTITGLTGSQNTLQNIFGFKGRVYLAQQGQLGFYYLGIGAIQGAASYFDLGQIARKGGSVIGIASYSADSGNGPADFIVFMTTTGEYIVYSGTDPSNAATWTLVGRYYASPPIGRKGWFNFRADLYVITQEGILSMNQLLLSGDEGSTKQYLTGKLGDIYTAYTANSATQGWGAVLYPRSGLLVVNVPKSDAASKGYEQLVMNTTSNAWCRFTGWDGLSWCVCNGRMYYGTYDGRVVLADEGNSDNGVTIKADARQAPNYFDDGRGMGASDKQFHFVSFVVSSDGTPPITATLNVNFEDDVPAYSIDIPAPSGAVWDVAFWDAEFWAGSGEAQTVTISLDKVGYVASVWMRANVSGEPITWFATRVICERARGISMS